MKNEYKVSIPLFEPNELPTFDNHIHEIIEEYSKMFFKEKDQILTQRIIMKQQEEIERLNSIIKEVREKVNKYPEFNYSNDYMIFRNEIKEILDKDSDK